MGRIFDTTKDGQSTLSDFSATCAMAFWMSSSRASGKSGEGDMREYHGMTKCCTTRPKKAEMAAFTWEEKEDMGDFAGDLEGAGLRRSR